MLLLENQKNNLSQFIDELKDKIAAMDNDKDQLTSEVSFYRQSKIELSSQILVQENTINELKDRAKNLFISMHGSVAAFCNNLPHEISTIDAINVYEIQRNIRLDAYKDSVFLDETEAQINDFMDNVLSMLKDSLLLSEADVKTLIYDICGFNYRSIAYLLNVAPTAAGARRTRLKDKINKLDSEKQVICKKYINLL